MDILQHSIKAAQLIVDDINERLYDQEPNPEVEQIGKRYCQECLEEYEALLDAAAAERSSPPDDEPAAK